MLLVVSETSATHEHSLHDFFQTYLSDPLRHWLSDCNRPRHRTPGLPQIMLIMLWPCVSFFYINMTHSYFLSRWRERCSVSWLGTCRTPERTRCCSWSSSQVPPARIGCALVKRLVMSGGTVLWNWHPFRVKVHKRESMIQYDLPSTWKHPICKYTIFKEIKGSRLPRPSYYLWPLVYCVCRSFFVMLARCSLCILPLFYTRNS